ISFVPAVQTLAHVHHNGLLDRVSRRGTAVKYAGYQLLRMN
ncbi:virion morphogenesis protein, partial [Pantoea dispersa]